MDVINSAQTEYKKIETKHIDFFPKIIEKMQTSTLNQQITQDSTNEVETVKLNLMEILRSIELLTSQVNDDHKEFQKTISRYEKVIDKKWKQDITIASNPDAFVDKEPVLQRTIALHFIRQGKFKLVDTFMQDTQLMDFTTDLQEQFDHMYEILDAINNFNLELALEWAKSKRKELEQRGSSLEFDLHRLHYIKYLVKQQDRKGALNYARLNFNDFQTRHMHEIRRLMCAILYIDRLESSPYADLTSNDAWTDIQTTFTRDFCNLLKMSCDSPLYTSLTVGSTALPTIIKMATIMKEKKNEWSQQDELPVEVPLTDDMRFHSIFACPVSKEQSSEDNPPMMMPCGHVICKESLNKLSKGNGRFKCPYCPSESTSNQAVK
ncbi:6394_t:CDS:2, partial [Gigaspora rosea]